jgi:hypothetical protein
LDKVLKDGSGLLGIEIHPNPNDIAVSAQTLEMNTVHKMVGHPNAQVLAALASKYYFTKNNTWHTFPLVLCPNLYRKI